MTMIRQLFGPSRDEVWRKLAAEVQGLYVAGTFGKAPKVEVEHGPWTVTLDTYALSTGKTVIFFTRMRAPFVNPDAFRFTIYRKSVFSDVAKALGMQDIEIGDPPFDEDFIVQSTSTDRVRRLLWSDTIRTLVSQQKSIQFSVRDDDGWFVTRFPDGVDELYFAVPGIIKDLDRLKLLYDLFAETLDELCRMGQASDASPDVTVR